MNNSIQSIRVRTQFLDSLPLFTNTSEAVLENLARSSHIHQLEKGALLFNQTDPADEVYIVYSGCISLFLSTPDGRELVINEMHPGDCFGELALITDEPRSTGAIARESSEIISIPRETFIKGLEAEPELMRRVLKTTAQRLQVSSERESALAFLDSSSRIAKVLLQMDQQDSDYDVINITQEELAQHVGLTRQTVAKTLGQWRSHGWIITSRGTIKLLNRTAINQIAEALDN
ncbi:MAG: cyclic nucleotide-binding domain-containing protein [Anaerolineales bacterium]|nr:cyclic nucleotide-binding domain-containing protein [Anaerolineales bacterium]